MEGEATLLIGLMCRNEEEFARALEALSRPITGLVLEGIKVNIMKMDDV